METIAQSAITSTELFKKYFTKDYVSQLDSRFKTLTKEIKNRQKIKYDVVSAVTGFPGIGKTTLVILKSWLTNSNYSFEKHVCFIPTANEIEKKYYEIEKYGVFHIDEATKAMHKYKWWDSAQQKLNTIYDTERAGNYKATELIMPRFQNFTENFRNFRIMYWINIITRGVAIVYKKDEDKDVKDPWHIDENYKMKQKKWASNKKRVYDRSVADIIRMESKTQNYWFWFEFPELPEEILDLFMKMRSEAKAIALPEEQKPKSGVMMRKHLHRLYLSWLFAKKQNPELTMTDYAKETGISLVGLTKEIQTQESEGNIIS